MGKLVHGRAQAAAGDDRHRALCAASAAARLALTRCGCFLRAFGGCGFEKPRNRTVDFLIEASPTNLDPRIGADAYSEHLDGLIFSSLVAHDAQMNIIPDLADVLGNARSADLRFSSAATA